jgi:hypothetical protein
MLELSKHILDIVENSVRAGSRTVIISVIEDTTADTLTLEIRDDGRGMTAEEAAMALDPFYTTKKVRRVGLGLPMLKSAAEMAGGSFRLDSTEGKGTTVTVTFGHSHIDRQPLGDVGLTLVTLIMGSPKVDFIYTHRSNDREYQLDTRDIKRELGDVPIEHVEVLSLIRGDVEKGIKEIGASAQSY